MTEEQAVKLVDVIDNLIAVVVREELNSDDEWYGLAHARLRGELITTILEVFSD